MAKKGSTGNRQAKSVRRLVATSRGNPPPARNGQAGKHKSKISASHRNGRKRLGVVPKEAEKGPGYYSDLFVSAPFGYLILNQDGIILEINRAAAALLGLTREHLLGEAFARFLPEEIVPDFLNYLSRCKPGSRKVTAQLVLNNHAGAAVPVELTGTVSQKPGSEPQYRTAIANISGHRRVEAALTESRGDYRNLVDSIDGIVWEAAAGSGTFAFVSRQVERILGYPVERWLEEPGFWYDHIHLDDRERVWNLHNRPGITSDFVVEFRMYTNKRRILWLRNNVTVTRDDHDRAVLRGVMVNITELKEASDALHEETHIMETLNRTGGALAAELDPEKLIKLIAHAGGQVTGARFGAFAYYHPGRVDPLLLYVTPGTPREIFSKLPMPRQPATVSAENMERKMVRIDDVLNNPGAPAPLRATSKGKPPVRSFLAVPIISRSGELLGSLFFGHPSPNVFNERSQRLLLGVAAEAGIALDNARLYHAIRKSESHFRQLADAMPQIVWTAQPDGRLDYFNQRWYEFSGLPPGSPHGEGFFALIEPEERARCLETWEESVASGQLFQTGCRLREHKTGTYRWHLVRAVPIRDENNQLASWFGTCTDIEDQKHAEEEVRELNSDLERRVSERTAQLQASNKELEAFSYSVSHDLRAPLRSIDAFSQMVREDYESRLDDQGKQYLTIIGEASRHMSHLIDDILHLSRITRGELRRRPVDLSAIAGEITGRLRQVEPERQVETIIAPNLQANADERLMRVALENLLNNSWKFSSKRPDSRVEFGGELQDGQTVFFVRDNGAGFDMAYSGKLFGAFQRLHSANDFPGHGIGLATVQRIVNRHGGRIWAQSAANEGSTFYFSLPEEG